MSGLVPRERRTRFLLAGVVAPPVGIAVTLVLGMLTLEPTDASLQDLLASYGHALFFLMLFGLPPSYVVEVALGLPLYRALKARGKLTLFNVVVLAGIAGGLVFAGSTLLFFPMDWSEGFAAMFPFGVAGGVAAGVVLWVIALRHEAG